jgi:uncharacterized paraquat-inducible protein A
MFKTLLRVVSLALCAVVGLWAVIHGFALAITASALRHEDMLQFLVEVSVSIAGGVCVLSVAVQQLNCWRTHHKDEGLI